MAALLSLLLACASLGSATPVGPRTVSSLNEAAFAEAQQRDDGATRAFSNVQIKTSDGQCLFVDELSGDFRANLTPIQVGACGATNGQGWDIITSGKHNNAANSMIIVSTLTQACWNFDPRRAAGNQVLLFSCGGRADGGGSVTNSQLFTFNGGSGPLSFQPENDAGSCFTVKGNVLDVAQCNSGDAKQSFTFGGAALAGGNGGGNSGKTTAASSPGKTGAASTTASATTSSAKEASASKDTAVASTSSTTCTQRTRTVTASAINNDQPGNEATTSVSSSSVAEETTSTTEESASATEVSSSSSGSSSAGVTTNAGIAIANPTTPVPVSRAGGTLNPTAAAESQQRDDTATRAFSEVEIRAPNGQCLFVDPTAGDFRQNLIPIGLVDCGGTPNEKWDVITAGKHNNAKNSALIVSSLTQGCMSFDGRRQAGDTVTLFSCGGRADGAGGTNAGQLVPFIGALSFAFAPESENNKTCILPGIGRLDSGPCPTELGPQLFSIFP
ncbi:hypothetical protein BR93DRAFT_474125 [Coniochaeta sp. PMI_546]|nr:hypothetical protein BR93DRAFT_474125 [Coniochaeta sp. PMI_546]